MLLLPPSRKRPEAAAVTTWRRRWRCVWGILIVVSASCATSNDDGGSGRVAIEAGPHSTLSAVVEVTTDEPSRVELTATATDHEVVVPPTEDLASSHELALVGLRPSTDYQVNATVVDEEGTPVDVGEPQAFASGPLPDDFPPIELEADTTRTAPGLTLLSLKSWGAPEDGQLNLDPPEGVPKGYLAAVDQDGFVVWYVPTELGILDVSQTDDSYLFTYDETVVREVDVQGRLTTEVAGRVASEVARIDGLPRTTGDATPMDTDSAHHDVGALPNGNLLLLSTELRDLTGPPQCGEDDEEVTYSIIADVVVEVAPDTGEVVQQWPLLDVYDPFSRPGEELCNPGPPLAPPNAFYPAEAKDWTHGNSVVLDEANNALVVSLRHLNAVVALRYQSDGDGPAGERLWELGPDGTLALDGEPTYHQHAAEVMDDGRLLVYDNGNTRPGASPGGEGAPPYSRAVIYEIDRSAADPADWTARQVWEHRLEEPDGRPTFTAILGDVDELDDGNILVTHGAINDGSGVLSARVVEVARDEDDEVVFDLRVGDGTTGWSVYRSQRIPSLYPPGA